MNTPPICREVEAGRSGQAIPELKLERYLLGELPEKDALAIRSAVLNDPEVRARVEALEVSNRALLDAHPTGPFVAAVERKLAASAPPGQTRQVWTWALAPLAAAALTAFYLGPASMRGLLVAPSEGTAVIEGDRSKGDGPDLVVFVKKSGDTGERLTSGALVHQGDIIQVAYRIAASNFGVIVSVDGRGRVTQHFPLSGTVASRLRAGGAVLLDAAYRLDDAPRAERFFLVTSREPFAIEPVLTAALSPIIDVLSTDRLPLGPTLAQASFLLKKE